MRLNVKHIPINRQGYDSSGRYWGVGPKLYHVFDDSVIGEPEVDVYTRAIDAKTARAQVEHKLKTLAQPGFEDWQRTRVRSLGNVGAAPGQACRQGMRLVHLPVNQAWAFKFGDAIIALEGFSRFFQTRAEATAAAQLRGLALDRYGCVVVAAAPIEDATDRRIAYLQSRGEDQRNTAAWRDAMYERRVRDVQRRARG